MESLPTEFDLQLRDRAVTSLEFAFSISEGRGPQRTPDRRGVREGCLTGASPCFSEAKSSAVAPSGFRPIALAATHQARLPALCRSGSRLFEEGGKRERG